MTIDPVKVPANVQVEEKIIGPMSLRQIAILLITGGGSYSTWTLMQKQGIEMNIVTHTLPWIPFIMGVAFCFVVINGVSLFSILLLAIEKIEKPTSRTFGPRKGITLNIRTGLPDDKKKPVESKKLAPKDQLEELSTILDGGLEKMVKDRGIELVQKEGTYQDESVMQLLEPEKIYASEPSEEHGPIVDDFQPQIEPEPEPPANSDGTNNLLRDIYPA